MRTQRKPGPKITPNRWNSLKSMQTILLTGLSSCSFTIKPAYFATTGLATPPVPLSAGPAPSGRDVVACAFGSSSPRARAVLGRRFGLISIAALVGHRTALSLQGTPRRVPRGSPGKLIIVQSELNISKVFGISEEHPTG